MDIIELTRQLGKEIQKDDRYLNMHLASQNCEDDQQLQDLILHGGQVPLCAPRQNPPLLFFME